MLRTIKLHGSLGERFGKEIKLDCDNVFHVMSALGERFGAEFREAIRLGRWHVIDGAIRKGNDLDEKTLERKLAKKVLHILPVVEGASSGFRVVLGVVLMVVGVYTGQGWLVQMGAALAVGGVVEMLTKPKDMNQSEKMDQAQSSLFNSARNVTTQGGPIPLIYGRVRRASSVVITSDFSATQSSFDLGEPDYPPVGEAIP